MAVPVPMANGFLKILLLATCLKLAGCGEPSVALYPVSGKVTYPDGTAVTGGVVEFQSVEAETSGRNARSPIGQDGSFSLVTIGIGDGAVAGRHRAIVQGPRRRTEIEEGESSPPPTIDRKFRSYATSGLEFVVETKANEITIVVTPPKR